MMTTAMMITTAMIMIPMLINDFLFQFVVSMINIVE